jgi:hypothetical protein
LGRSQRSADGARNVIVGVMGSRSLNGLFGESIFIKLGYGSDR